MSHKDSSAGTEKKDRFDGHVKAWGAREIEAFWMQAILEDRAETALPPPHVWRPDHADG